MTFTCAFVIGAMLMQVVLSAREHRFSEAWIALCVAILAGVVWVLAQK